MTPEDQHDINKALGVLDEYCKQFIKADSGNLRFDLDGHCKTMNTINEILNEYEKESCKQKQ
jgi:hypothetical protein